MIMRVLGPGADPNAKIYGCSGQSLNFKEMAAANLRAQLNRTKNATFTYSMEFLSQVLCFLFPKS